MGERWRISVVAGKARPEALELPEAGAVTLGRSEACGLRLEGGRVSREHARLTREGPGWVLEDLGSSTGTRVGGEAVTRRVLRAGDRIEIGGTVLELAGPAMAAGPGEDSGRARLLEALTGLLAADARPLPELLAGMLDELIAALGADRGIMLVPGEGGALEPLATRVRPGSTIEAEPVSRGLVARVAKEGTAVLASSLEAQELRQEFRSIPGVLCSIVAAPAPMAGGAGVLYLDSVLERRRFGEADRELLRAFGRAAGSALARRAELGREKGRAERMAELLRRTGEGGILGDSPAMTKVLGELGQAARTDVTVLVSGETGTGKELVARALHRRSARAAGPFVAVNCAAIPAELLESELFGHEKGAFTGAAERRLGHFELADGGTLFLDEVGELPAGAQAKLLRALQEKSVQRLGAARPVAVDFRLVAATHQELEAGVKAGRFREDLFYRLAVFRIRLPPLRERGGDTLLLARELLARAARDFGKELAGFEPAAEAMLVAHAWPGNIRELRNVVEQAVVREEGRAISPASLAPALGGPGPARPAGAAGEREAGLGLSDFPPRIDEARREFERRYLLHHLERHGGNMTVTAAALGLSRRNLYTRCQEAGVDYARFR